MPTKANRELIVKAAGLGDSATVIDLLEGGTSPNSIARRQDGEIFGGVITTSRGSAVFTKKGHGDTYHPTISALQAAASGGHQEATEILIAAGALVNAPGANNLGRTALQGAAENGHDKIFQLLLEAGANVNAPASQCHGISALQGAAGSGRSEIVKLLLRAKAEVNAPAPPNGGRTALQAAAENGYEGVVKLLLEAKAGANAPASKHSGRTALQAAAENGHEGVVKLLLEAKADANAPASKHGGRTALCGAARNGYGEIVKLLLDAKANPDGVSPGEQGRTALVVAMEGGHVVVAKHLLDFKADTNQAWDGRPIIHHAASRNAISMVKLLISRGANPNLLDSSGETILHKAVIAADISWLRSLVDLSGFDIDAPNLRGQTPLQLALEAQRDRVKEIFTLLLAKGASTDGLSVETLPRAKGDNEAVFLEKNQAGNKSTRWDSPMWDSICGREGQSICLLP